MKYILHMLGSTERGGAQTFVMNLFHAIDRNQFSFDFYIANNVPGAYDLEIERLGGKIYRNSSSKHGLNKYYVQYISQKRFFEAHREYDTIHLHTNSSTSVLSLIAAKNAGVSQRIVHSHSTGTKKSITHFLFRWLLPLYATEMIACGIEAGRFLYGKRFNTNNVIPNAIDADRFTYSEDNRRHIREQVGINDEIVIGHIGRFVEVKNHRFIIDCFSEYKLMNPHSKLMLVGSGELMETIETYAAEKGVLSDVLFLGDREDVYALLSAMDILVLPSFHEGIPITLIEAQANGIPIFASSTVAYESKQTNCVEFLDLAIGANKWAEAINNRLTQNISTRINKIVGSTYDVKTQVKRISQLYRIKSSVK